MEPKHIPPMPPPPRPTQRTSDEVGQGVAKGMGRFALGCFGWTVSLIGLLVLLVCWQAWEPEMGFFEFLLSYLSK